MSAVDAPPTESRRRRKAPWPGAMRSLRRALAGTPRAARVCALLAFLNAVCWSLITPPFLVLDEGDHFAYVQQLAETASLPTSANHEYSPEQLNALKGLHNTSILFGPEGHPIRSSAEQARLERLLSRHASRRGGGGTGFSASQPPLYYALETIPYGLGSGATLLARLQLMRLMSAFMGAATALFAFLFLRELLPGSRWAWTVGGLGVAFAPLLGISSGGVTPDALLFAVAAALFYALARTFRRGLTQRAAIAIGALIAVGFLTKLNFVGLVPGALLGLVLLARRHAQGNGWRASARLLAPGLALALGPPVVFGAVNLLSGNETFGAASSLGGTVLGWHSTMHALSYTWQLFLPRLPWMHNYFGGPLTAPGMWFRALVGLYGWNDTAFPHWAYDIALVLAMLIVLLCARAFAADRVRLRARADEILTYVAMSVGLLVLVGASGYVRSGSDLVEYVQPRYLVPLIALWGAVLALAARGAGRRWGPVVGALLVALVIGHDLFSQLQVIARYYG